VLEGFSKKLRGLLRKVGGRTPAEDLATSTVIGGLAHMPPTWALTALSEMFGSRLDLPYGDAVDVKVKLWPSRTAGSKRVEPDALIELMMGTTTEKRTLLIEAKWDHHFTDDQLLLQRQAFAPHHHILLVRRESEAAPHVDDPSQVVITWQQVASGLVSLGQSPKAEVPLRRWAQAVSDFLAEMGERPFMGFRRMNWVRLCSRGEPLFYCNRFEWPECSFVTPAKAVRFFTATGQEESDRER